MRVVERFGADVLQLPNDLVLIFLEMADVESKVRKAEQDAQNNKDA